VFLQWCEEMKARYDPDKYRSDSIRLKNYRDEEDLDEIREYIINNPLKWDLDRENPTNIEAC
jgi:hypothetical protein